MDLDKHRAISYCAFKRCQELIPKLQNNAQYRKIFYPLLMGNWLTDINQTSAFFSFLPDGGQELKGNKSDPDSLDSIQWRWLRRCLGHQEMERTRRAREKQKTDYYQNRKNGAYVLPSFFRARPDFTKRWEQLIASLWEEEWL
ncbi:MAG: hypothetical protein D3908_17140, partial [Candidatus Electrothrix sp. AUS4]|nr:hypothetical protein [Candidatus Electrothrix sp. AUS4]